MKIEKNLIWSLIPVKKNSKRVKNKNKKKINGIPLFVYSILASLSCKKIKKTFISTDDKFVKKTSEIFQIEVPFLRPKKISGSKSEDYEYVNHFLNFIKKKYEYLPEFIIQLRPTSPFRSIKELNRAIKNIEKDVKATSLRSSHLADHPPEKQFRIKNKYYCNVDLKKIRNDKFNKPSYLFKKTFEPNGYIDILKTQFLLKNKKKIYGEKILPFITKKIIDIDTEEDFKIAQNIKSKEKNFFINKFKK